MPVHMLCPEALLLFALKDNLLLAAEMPPILVLTQTLFAG